MGFQGNLRNDRKYVIRPVPVTALEDFLQKGFVWPPSVKGCSFNKGSDGVLGFVFYNTKKFNEFVFVFVLSLSPFLGRLQAILASTLIFSV